MKKILLIILVSIGALSTPSLFALSYGGTSNFSIPAVYSNTGELLYSVQATNNTNTIYTTPVFDSVVSSSARLISYTYGLRFQSGSLGSYSGVLSTLNQADCGFSNNGYVCNWWNQLNINLNISTGSTKSSLYISIEKLDMTNGDSVFVTVAQIPQFTIDNNQSCPGLSSDCILIIQPRFYQKISGSNQGLYLAYIDYTWYYDSDKKTNYYRAYFGDLTENGPDPTAWQSVLDWFGLGSVGFGLYTGYSYPTPSLGAYGSYQFFYKDSHLIQIVGNNYGLITPIAYSLASAPANDDSLLRDYFVGNTGSIIDTLFPTWVGASGIQFSVIGSDGSISNPSNSGSTTSGADFSACTSFLDVGCYIEASYNAFASWIDGLWSGLWDYFIPDISFTGQSSTCMGTGSTLSSSGGLDFMQKFVNLFVVAVPIAPPQDSTICTLDGQKTIHYSSTDPNVVDMLLIFVTIVPIFFGARQLAGTNKPS